MADSVGTGRRAGAAGGRTAVSAEGKELRSWLTRPESPRHARGCGTPTRSCQTTRSGDHSYATRARWWTTTATDDSSDDNREDNRMPNCTDNTAVSDLSCLFRRFAWSWQCGGQGFESP